MAARILIPGPMMNGAKPTLLLIERDDVHRTALAEMLSDAGYPTRAYAGARAFTEAGSRYSPGECLVIGASRDRHAIELLERRDEDGMPPAAIVLASRADAATAIRCFKSGASDVLIEPIDSTSLAGAVGRAIEWADEVREDRRRLEDIRRRVARLTPREREVFALLVTGLLNKQIAAELGATERTIKAHRSRIMEKCEVESLAELVRLYDTIEMSHRSAHRSGPFDVRRERSVA